MNEESPQFLSANDKRNDVQSVLNYITLELKKEGITVIQNNIEGIVITDKKVPEQMMLSLHEFAENKGFNIAFRKCSE